MRVTKVQEWPGCCCPKLAGQGQRLEPPPLDGAVKGAGSELLPITGPDTVCVVAPGFMGGFRVEVGGGCRNRAGRLEAP